MKPKLIVLILFLTSSLAGQTVPHVITFYIRPLPVSITSGLQKSLDRQKKTPAGKLGRPGFENLVKMPFLHTGVYAAYAGMVTHSDPDGQILFERRSPEAKLNVIITEDIKPVPIDPLNNKTLYGFIIDSKAQAQQYSIERMLDPETELYSWYITEKPVLRGRRIPYDTLIIFANPKHVVVPLGATATRVNESFMLPDFYATEGHNSAANAFQFLKVRHYFAAPNFDYKFLPEQFQKKMLPS